MVSQAQASTASAFDSFVDRIEEGEVKIPPYPATATRLADLIASDKHTLAKLAEIIQLDQVLSASVLRYANSADVQQGKKPATSVQAAVARIGTSQIVRLAFALGVGSEVARPGTFLDLRKLYWRHAVTSAEFCRDAAVFFGVDPNQAYLCGLLHDFGKVIGLGCLEESLRGQDIDNLPSPQDCFQTIENHHQRLGQLMAFEWNLSDDINDVMARHHQADDDSSALLKLVAICDLVVQALDSQPWFARELLNDVPFLNEGQKDELYPLIVGLPARVRALDIQPTKPTSKRRRQSMQPKPLKKETTLRGPRFQVDYKVEIAEGGSPGKFRAIEQCQMGLALSGDSQLSEQSLIKVRMETGDDVLDFWGTVALCTACDKKQYRVEVHPIGLEGIAAERWEHSVAKALLKPAIATATLDCDQLRERLAAPLGTVAQQGKEAQGKRRSKVGRSTQVQPVAWQAPAPASTDPERESPFAAPNYGSFDAGRGWTK